MEVREFDWDSSRKGACQLPRTTTIRLSTPKTTTGESLFFALTSPLSKAFDRVVHQELIFTLHSLGIHSSALKWFASYLNGRYQRVCIASGTSSLLPVTRGVPRRTILGPTIFNLNVRVLPDLAAGSGAKLLMFADDKTSYASSRDPIVCADITSSALAKLHNELRSLGMSVNVEKTVVMRILPKNAPDVRRPVLVELGSTTLREVSVIRCLGILMDNKLSFVPHVDHLTSKVSCKIGALRRTFRQMAAFARRQYLLNVIHPDFEYCFPVYASHLSAQSRERLFTLFRRDVRVTCGASYHAAVPPLLASLQIKHLEYRYEEEDAEHDDESVEQGGGDQVLTRRSVDTGEEEKRSDGSVGEVDTEDEADGDEACGVGCDCDLELDVKKSAVYRHLVGHPDCCHSYSDFSFTVLCRASHTHIMQLKVLEAIFIHLYKPVLCVQKESVITLKFFT